MVGTLAELLVDHWAAWLVATMAGQLTAYSVATSADLSAVRKAVQKVADLVEHSVAQKADPSV